MVVVDDEERKGGDKLSSARSGPCSEHVDVSFGIFRCLPVGGEVLEQLDSYYILPRAERCFDDAYIFINLLGPSKFQLLSMY